jgi:serine/threonine protein kinase
VLQLEKLPMTFNTFIKEEKTVNKILDCYKELVSLIFYTQRTYVFQHCDLSYNNIMIKDGHIKLIDFGLGRMILDTHIYMPDGEDIQDLDFDLLKIFSQLTLCDPLSDELYEMVIKSTNEKTLIEKIESFKTE